MLLKNIIGNLRKKKKMAYIPEQEKIKCENSTNLFSPNGGIFFFKQTEGF